MCSNEKNMPTSETQSQYRVSERREYGTVKSVDISFKLIKEFLEMRNVIENIPFNIPVEDMEGHERLQKLVTERVKPFIENFNEVLNNL